MRTRHAKLIRGAIKDGRRFGSALGATWSAENTGKALYPRISGLENRAYIRAFVKARIDRRKRK